jgi:hypothetical protein
VDELHVMVGNGVLGDGVPAFPVRLPERLPLLETRRLEGSDNVLLVYAVGARNQRRRRSVTSTHQPG